MARSAEIPCRRGLDKWTRTAGGTKRSPLCGRSRRGDGGAVLLARGPCADASADAHQTSRPAAVFAPARTQYTHFSTCPLELNSLARPSGNVPVRTRSCTRPSVPLARHTCKPRWSSLVWRDGVDLLAAR